MKRVFPRRWRLASSTACSALALASCGGAGETTTRAEQPVLPASLAAELAAQADEVAILLENGDPAGAEAAALELDAAVENARAEGRLPRPLAQRLEDAIDRLLAAIPAAEGPVDEEPPPDEENKDEEKDEGAEGEDKGNGEGEKKNEEKKDEEKEAEDDLGDTVTSVTETVEGDG